MVPFSVRWRFRLLQRLLQDRRDDTKLAMESAHPRDFPHLVCQYERPLIKYPSQEAQFAGKRRNNELALAAIDQLLVAPQETFSFWACVGRPTAKHGYASAAAIKNRVLTLDIGGALCLASTLMYNVGLLSGLTITERHCHSVDSYGDERYFELGRDASVEFPYTDLRFRNDLEFPIMLRSSLESNYLLAQAWSPHPVDLEVGIEVTRPAPLPPGPRDISITGPARRFHVQTVRKVAMNGSAWTNDLGRSVYQAGH